MGLIFLDGSTLSLMAVFEKSRAQSRIRHLYILRDNEGQLPTHCIVFYDIDVVKGS